VRPLNAAKPATTSRISELSHVTVIRGACDCSPSRAWAARYASIESSAPLAAGAATRAASPARTPGLRPGLVLATPDSPTPGASPGLREATSWLDHAANA